MNLIHTLSRYFDALYFPLGSTIPFSCIEANVVYIIVPEHENTGARPHTMNGSDEALKYSLMLERGKILLTTILVFFQLVVFELEKCEVPDVSFVTEPKIMGEPVYRH